MNPISSLRAISTRTALHRSCPQLRQLSSLPRRRTYQRPEISRQSLVFSRRWNSSLSVPQSELSNEPPRPERPSYQLTFTCKPCGHRSAHQVTKQGFHKGTTLITCPSCKNRHVITDHLKIFGDEAVGLEDILRKKLPDGQDLSKLLKKGKLGMRQGEIVGREGDENIEFWEDGTESEHVAPETSVSKP